MPDHFVRLERHSHEDALAKLTRWLREKSTAQRQSFEREGTFQFCIRSVIQEVLQEQWQSEKPHSTGGMTITQFDEATNTGPFVDAAWDLTRHGILAPAMVRQQSGVLAFPGDEFRLTEYGQHWVSALAREDVLPTEYGRFAGHLDKHAHRFRSAYRARSQEALKCYRATVYLACCAMCGAAAESILLSLVIAKTGDEYRVLKDYRSSNGLTKIKRILAHQQNTYVLERLENFTDLLKFWRDDAAHASDTVLDEEVAFLAMLLLLRLARFADEKWPEIVGTGDAG